MFTFAPMQKNKYLYLEGLRGVLALIVVIHHFILLFYPDVFYGTNVLSDYHNNSKSLNLLIANTPLNIFMNGTWAVCMFMLLSGFVLCLRYYETNDASIIRTSFFKRYFRLAIPVLGAVLIIYFLFRLNVFQSIFYPRAQAGFDFGKDLFTKDISFLSALQMGLVDVPLNGNNTYLPVFWTIDIEFVGVLLLFAFLLISHNTKYRVHLFVLFILFLFYISKTYYILIMVGSLIALLKDKIELMGHKKYIFIVLFLIGWYLEGIPNLQDIAKQHTWYWYTVGLPQNVFLYFQFASCAFMFVALLSFTKVQKFLSSKAMQFLGSISFSMYLLHLPVLFITGSKLLHYSHGGINPILLFLICVIAIVVFSYLFYRFVDKMAITLSNKIGKWVVKKES